MRRKAQRFGAGERFLACQPYPGAQVFISGVDCHAGEFCTRAGWLLAGYGETIQPSRGDHARTPQGHRYRQGLNNLLEIGALFN